MMRGKTNVSRGPGTGPRKKYKNRDLYVCLALNKLVGAMDIDIGQKGLEAELDRVLLYQQGLPKNSLSNEMHTNYSQTRKVLDFLRSKGYVTVESSDRVHLVKITKDGILFIRKTNGYFAQTYADTIQDHYKYSRLPAWFRAETGMTT